MRILSPTERKNNLMVAIAEKLKKQSGENVPQPTPKMPSIQYTNNDTVIRLQGTPDNTIEELAQVLESLLDHIR